MMALSDPSLTQGATVRSLKDILVTVKSHEGPARLPAPCCSEGEARCWFILAGEWVPALPTFPRHLELGLCWPCHPCPPLPPSLKPGPCWGRHCPGPTLVHSAAPGSWHHSCPPSPPYWFGATINQQCNHSPAILVLRYEKMASKTLCKHCL